MFALYQKQNSSQTLVKGVTIKNKPVALVAGANQGLCLQVAKDLITHGFTVLVA